MRRLQVNRPRVAVRATIALSVAVISSSVVLAGDAIYAVDLGDGDRAPTRARFAAQNVRWIGMLDSDRALVRADSTADAAWAEGREAFEFGTDQKAPRALAGLLGRATAGERGFASAFVVIPSDRSRATRRRIGAMSSAFGGVAELVESDALTMRVVLDRWGLRQLLASPDVLWAEPAMAPGSDDDLVRDFGGANYVELVDGYTGAGVVCEVIDGGLRTTHSDFAAPPPVLRTANTAFTGHGTSTYGTLFGDGASDSGAYGMIPDAVGLFSSYHNISDRDAHLASFVAAPHFGVMQSNSWGTGINRRYTAVSAEMDDSVFRHGVILLQSQSNNGNPDSRPEAWAKNVVSIGGVRGRGTLDRGDDAWEGEASTGPALDGRIKPDLVMFNDGIWSPADGSDTDHRSFTGTSAATPAVAGHFGIMLEMWDAGLFAAPDQTWQAESGGADEILRHRPSAAMAKALMINSARPYVFGHVADDLGRYRQGWGTPDLRRLRDGADRTFVLDETAPLLQGESWVQMFVVAPGEPELRSTLVYADPAGLPMAVSAIVNDLDLRVTSPSGVVFYGNAGLHGSPVSTPGGVADRVNTVENVFVPQPEAGRWQIEVFAHRVNEDADDSTPEFDVPFAIVAAGAFASETPALVPVGGAPGVFEAGTPVTIEIDALGFSPVGDGEMTVQTGAGLSSTPLVWMGGTRFTATLNDLPCGSVSGVRFVAHTAEQAEVSFPPIGDGMIPVRVASHEDLVPQGDWEAEASAGLGSGWWEHGVPGGGGLRWDPPADADGDGVCWLTDNRAGLSDVSGGTSALLTPSFGLGGVHSAALHCDVWIGCDDAGGEGEDTLTVACSTDGGATWTPLAEERSTFRWVHRVYDLSGLIASGSDVRFRFTVGDSPDDSITEAAVDSVRVVADRCSGCPADFDGDGDADLQDLHRFTDAFQAQTPGADTDNDGDVDLNDLLLFLFAFEPGCGA